MNGIDWSASESGDFHFKVRIFESRNAGESFSLFNDLQRFLNDLTFISVDSRVIRASFGKVRKKLKHEQSAGIAGRLRFE